MDIDDDEPQNPTIEEGVEPTHESIDLPIATSESIAVGEGLRKQSSKDVTAGGRQPPSTQSSRDPVVGANQLEELEVDSDDLPDDEDDFDNYGEDDY